jgi:hypothetical protein
MDFGRFEAGCLGADMVASGWDSCSMGFVFFWPDRADDSRVGDFPSSCDLMCVEEKHSVYARLVLVSQIRLPVY